MCARANPLAMVRNHIRQISVQVWALRSPPPRPTRCPLACVFICVWLLCSVTEAMRYARTRHSFVTPMLHLSVPNYLLCGRSSRPMWSVSKPHRYVYILCGRDRSCPLFTSVYRYSMFYEQIMISYEMVHPTLVPAK